MDKRPEPQVLALVPRMLVGEWYVPTHGFQWRSDIRLIQPPAPRPEELRYARPYTWRERESDPWLYRVSDETERYPILRRRGLLSSFEKLAWSPTRGRIKGFANNYGWLGRPAIVQVGRGRSPDVSVAEPLSLWLWELGNLRDLVKLRDAVVVLQVREGHDRNERHAAQQLLAGRISWSSSQRSVSYESALQEEPPQDTDALSVQLYQALRRRRRKQGTLVASLDGGEREQLAFNQLKPGNDLSAAELVLREAVNERLTGNVNVAVTPQGEVRFWPQDLLTAVYLLFAVHLSGARPVEKACKNPRCPSDRPFYVTRRDKQYCSKNCREQARYHRSPTGKKKGAPDVGQKS